MIDQKALGMQCTGYNDYKFAFTPTIKFGIIKLLKNIYRNKNTKL